MSVTTTPRRWATRTQAAEHVRVSPETIDNWVTQGLLTAYRFSARVIRYDLNEIDEIGATTAARETSA